MTAAKAKTSPLPKLAEMADELGTLEKEYAVAMAPLEMKLARIKALKSSLQMFCPAQADKEWFVFGEKFGVRLSPRSNERSIDYKKLLSKISLASFVRFATCTLKALEKNVTPEIVAQVVSTKATGDRRFTIFEKGALPPTL